MKRLRASIKDGVSGKKAPIAIEMMTWRGRSLTYSSWSLTYSSYG
ncbi:hypothetical protein ACVWXM_008797 [Bradyrhizobium sp. GM7.3]